jgi:hypothetical protein
MGSGLVLTTLKIKKIIEKNTIFAKIKVTMKK